MKSRFMVLGLCALALTGSMAEAAGTIQLLEDGAVIAIGFPQSATVEIPTRGIFFETGGKGCPLVNFTVPEKNGSDSPPDFIGKDEEGRIVHFRVFPEANADRVRVEIEPQLTDVTAVGFSIRSRWDEKFYGMGDPRTGSLNLRGQTIRMQTSSGSRPVPFFMSSALYGLYVDDHRAGSFDFGWQASNEIRISFPGPRLVFHVIGGPTLMDVLTQYARITGFPPMPPRWSFLPWTVRMETDRDGAMETRDKLAELDIPCGVMLIGNLLDTGKFPELEEMIRDLNRKGIEIVTRAMDFNQPNAASFEEGLSNGYYINPGEGEGKTPEQSIFPIDFTKSEAFDWWKSELLKTIRMGIAGFDTEMKGPEQAHFLRCCTEALTEIRKDDFALLTRAVWAGSQETSTTTRTDSLEADFSPFRGLGAAVISLQGLGMTGFPFFASPIGGTDARPDPEVFARWCQKAAFSPIMLSSHAPWEFGEETIDIYRRYAKLHSEFLPYILHYAEIAHEMGRPIVRALALDYPEDPNTANLWDQYDFGRDILVAPMVRSATNREIYLPEGSWYDFWTHDRIEGATRIQREAPLDLIPVYVRAGTILPLEVKDATTEMGDTFSAGRLTLSVYPAAPEAGDRNFYLRIGRGGRERYSVRASGPDRIVISTPERPGGFILRVVHGGKPARVQYRGIALPELPREEMTEKGRGWWYSEKQDVTYVKIPGAGANVATILEY